MCEDNSTRVVCRFGISAKFSAISIPIKPPPITTAFLAFVDFRCCFIFSASARVLTVKILGLFIPEIFGIKGFAPGARISLS